MAIRDTLYSLSKRAAVKFGLKRDLGPTFLGSLADVPSDERVRTPMHEAFYSVDDRPIQKWRHYFDIYDRHLNQYRGKAVKFIEIGVWRGGSLAMWRRYLGNTAVIFGIDISADCARYGGDNAEVRIGSQADPAFLERIVAEMGGVDVVIDDGSHIASHQTTSFRVLFPLLSPKGTYICEDTHTAYWRGGFEGGYRRRNTFVELAKAIVDDVHGDFHRHPLGVKNANRLIHGLHFYNSMVVIEKAPQSRPMEIISSDAAGSLR